MMHDISKGGGGGGDRDMKSNEGVTSGLGARGALRRSSLGS